MSTAGMNATTTAVTAAIGEAIKASGAIVRVDAEAFLAILRRSEAPLVVHATGGFITKKHRYLTSYKGFAFFTKGPAPLRLPPAVELVEAKTIWVPEM